MGIALPGKTCTFDISLVSHHQAQLICSKPFKSHNTLNKPGTQELPSPIAIISPARQHQFWSALLHWAERYHRSNYSEREWGETEAKGISGTATEL